jgi:hypothetical protein
VLKDPQEICQQQYQGNRLGGTPATKENEMVQLL